MFKHIKTFLAFVVSFSLLATSSYADAVKKYATGEFSLSTLSEKERIKELKWFQKAAKPFKGMEINVLSETIPTHEYESKTLTKAFEEITGINEIVRATVESVAYQTYDLFEAMKNDGLRPKLVRVDGGMVKNNWFSQFLSDVVDVKVLRPKVDETTALGAAFMAGLKIGVYKSLKDISKNWTLDKKFSPKMKNLKRKNLISGWEKAIKRSLIT